MQFHMTAALAAAVMAFFAGQAQAQGAYLESIRHSGNWDKHNLKGETTPVMLLKPAEETVETPKDGPFIKTFNGTNFKEIMRFAEQHNVDLPFVFSNPAPNKGKGEGMCVLAGASNLNQDTSVSFKREDTNGMLYVPQNTSALW
jgi:hypothetical protein